MLINRNFCGSFRYKIFIIFSNFNVRIAKNIFIEKPLSGNYPEGPISDTILKILKDELKIPKDKLGFNKKTNKYDYIEGTKNQDKIKGNHHAPLDVVTKMCNKSIPAKHEDPGYFFFETQDGFNFKSIDGLIDEGIKSFSNDKYAEEHTYYYFASLAANFDKRSGKSV